ncbi:MAG: GH92 family glycosyl hydrolase [Flavobacteriales bacterium]|nr:GH92 family glycosyl hydrolase [Flavobacteriales bacterium]
MKAVHCGILLAFMQVGGAMELASQVDHFIGTSKMGHVYPGATVPFGMVQLSPDTDTIPFLFEGQYTGKVYEYCAGYQYEDPTIVGFSHTHFSGTGHSDLGDIRIMPTTGELQLNPGTEGDPDSGYRSRFTHEREWAEPGYYAVDLLDHGVHAELTSTQRVGIHRYTLEEEEGGPLHVVMDFDAGIYEYPGKDIWTFVTVDNDSTLAGYRMSSGWARTRTVFFVIRFSKPMVEYGHKRRDAEAYGGFWRRFDQTQNFPEMAGRQIVAWGDFELDPNESLEVEVALSPTSVAGAYLNLDSEAAGRGFDRHRLAAKSAWDAEFERFEFEPLRPEDRTVLQTALYHTCLGPTLFSDVNGEFRSSDGRNDKALIAGEKYENYSTFSLWDTYRAQHPWLALMQPERNVDMIRSMLHHQANSPHDMLPIWSHWGQENWCMIGYHAVSVLADAAVKGLLDYQLCVNAFDASMGTVMNGEFDGQKERFEGEYVSCDTQGASVSKTLEMSYDDWCLLQITEHIGAMEAQRGDTAAVAYYGKMSATFQRLSRQYEHLWDDRVGFMRPRHANGAFRSDFDPLATHGQGFIEGNAWNYSLHVQQDPDWLVKAHGGPMDFVEHLEELFTMELPDEAIAHTEDVTRDGLVGCYVHGNEPSHHVPWLFALAGRNDRTEYWTRYITRTMYGPGVNGLCGNDDAGQMSAWYLFASLGFYPFCPGDDRYVLGSPSLRSAALDLGSGRTLKMETRNASESAVYVSQAIWNGQRLLVPWISHREISKGGTLVFHMSETPSADTYPNFLKWNL